MTIYIYSSGAVDCRSTAVDKDYFAADSKAHLFVALDQKYMLDVDGFWICA